MTPELVGFAASVCVALAAGWLFVRREARELDRALANLRDLS